MQRVSFPLILRNKNINNVIVIITQKFLLDWRRVHDRVRRAEGKRQFARAAHRRRRSEDALCKLPSII